VIPLLVSMSVQGIDKQFEGKRVLYVDSYHPAYESSQIKNAAAREILTTAGVELRFLYMDTKRNSAPAFGREAGERVWDEIKGWNPDLLIAADDATVKYLVQPRLRDAALPVVFIGVNADASVYGVALRQHDETSGGGPYRDAHRGSDALCGGSPHWLADG